MSGIQAKIVRYAKKQENLTGDEDRNQSIETDVQLTQMLELQKVIITDDSNKFIASQLQISPLT